MLLLKVFAMRLEHAAAELSVRFNTGIEDKPAYIRKRQM
jgi:hypothetical protein